MKRSLFLVWGLAACGGGCAGPTALGDEPAVGVSLIPDAGWPEEEDGIESPRSAEVAGVIDAVEEVSDTTWSLHLVDVETEAGWTVQITSPGRALAVGVGDGIEASFAYTFGQWGPTRASADVRDEAGEMLFWWGTNDQVSALTPPPGVVLEQGDLQATVEHRCGPWDAFQLIAEIDGEEAEIAFGAQQELSGVLVTNAGIKADSDDGSETECMDYYVGEAEVLIAF